MTNSKQVSTYLSHQQLEGIILIYVTSKLKYNMLTKIVLKYNIFTKLSPYI